jgi:hypothetical protein
VITLSIFFSKIQKISFELFELLDHKTLNKTLADQKLLKTNSADHEIDI